jgi:Fe-S oxidoreductase
VERFLTAFAAILRHGNYRFLLDMYANTSTKCGRCAVACQVYQASGDPHDVPCYRTNLLLDVYRR